MAGLETGLRSRETRVRLLAWSYLDAVEEGRQESEGGRGSSASSRSPRRNELLWREGSYRDLERVLERIPARSRLAFWLRYIRTHRGFNPAEKPSKLLTLVARRMPRFIYVPADVSQAAGYLESEAKEFSR